jgi:long-chain fatty acid transport protein
MRKFQQTVLICSIAAALAAWSGQVAASGFALIEQSASGLGNAYAGGAASAEDASTIFFNPAGMSRLQGRQIAVALHLIQPSTKFSNITSTAATGVPVPLGGAGSVLGGDGGDAGGMNYIPNFYYAMDINPQWKFGLGVNVPFGLKTDYDSGWAGRFQALKSEVKTVNINPSFAFKANDTVSLGFGVSYQKMQGEFTGMQNFVVAPGVSAGEGFYTMSADDWSWGYNLGALFQVNSDTRAGIAYRSEIEQNLRGSALITPPVVSALFTGGTGVTQAMINAAAAASSGNIGLDIKLPQTFSASIFHQYSPKISVMGDISWTGWSSVPKLEVIGNTGAPLLRTIYNWRDTYRISAGASYKYNDAWTSRIGVAFDQSPVRDETRTARLPDSDRTWLSIGAKYAISQAGAIDFGYAHLFMKDASINNNRGGVDTASTAAYGSLAGTYKNSVDILSVQYTHSF